MENENVRLESDLTSYSVDNKMRRSMSSAQLFVRLKREKHISHKCVWKTGRRSESVCVMKNDVLWGREPWSSGYGRRLMFRRSWVQIPALFTGWTFFTYFCCKKIATKINLKRPGMAHFLKKWCFINDNVTEAICLLTSRKVGFFT